MCAFIEILSLLIHDKSVKVWEKVGKYKLCCKTYQMIHNVCVGLELLHVWAAVSGRLVVSGQYLRGGERGGRRRQAGVDTLSEPDRLEQAGPQETRLEQTGDHRWHGALHHHLSSPARIINTFLTPFITISISDWHGGRNQRSLVSKSDSAGIKLMADIPDVPGSQD